MKMASNPQPRFYFECIRLRNPLVHFGASILICVQGPTILPIFVFLLYDVVPYLSRIFNFLPPNTQTYLSGLLLHVKMNSSCSLSVICCCIT